MSFSDDFNRSDENLEADAAWTRVDGNAGAIAIRTNVVAFLLTGDTAYTCTDQESTDHYTQVVRKLTDSKAHFECCIRLADKDNFIGARGYGAGVNKHDVFKRVANSFTLLGSTTTARAVDEIMYLGAVGDTITFKIDGVTEVEVTETAHNTITTQGLVARSHTSNPTIDNFEAGPLHIGEFTALSVMALPGQIQAFAAKTEAEVADITKDHQGFLVNVGRLMG